MAGVASMRALLLSSAALLIPTALWGQTADQPIILQAITVESDRAVQTQTATPSTIVDAEEIEERQASTVAELLDSVPGVTLVNGATPGGSAVNIRGFGAWSGTYGNDQMVQFQIDGAATGAEELYRIGTQLYTDPALYKQAEVIRGSVGTFEYGSGAVGGMVRMTTKDASDFTGGEPGFRLRQSLSYGSNGDAFASSTTLAYQPSERVELLFNYTTRRQSDYSDGAGNTVANTGFDTPSYLLKAKVHFGQDNAHALTFSYSDTQSSERDVPYDQFGETNFGNVDRDIHSKTSVLTYGYTPGSDLVNVEVSLSQADQEIIQNATASGGSALLDADQSYVTTKLTAKNTARFALGGTEHKLRTGVEYIEKDRLDASSAPGGLDTRKALFLVDDITAGRYTFSPAIRYEDQHIDGSEYGYGIYNNEALMGGASLRYAFDSGFAVFASASYSENMPILDDLTNVGYMTQSQKARTHELGFSYNAGAVLAESDALSLKLNAYQTRVWDMTTYSGVTDVEISGVEIEAAYSMASGLYADLNANFVKGTNLTAGATNDYWSQEPADQVRLGLGKRFDNGLNLKWEGVYNLEMDRASTVTPSSFIHSASASYTPAEGPMRGVEMRLRVENLFDEDYTPRLATRAAAGRSINLSLAKTF
jgi:hemoglobin/transferrin/lactoferrin receptor protein